MGFIMGSTEETSRTDETRKSGAQSTIKKQAATWLTLPVLLCIVLVIGALVFK